MKKKLIKFNSNIGYIKWLDSLNKQEFSNDFELMLLAIINDADDAGDADDASDVIILEKSLLYL